MIFGYDGKPDLITTWKGPKELQVECLGACTDSKIYREVVKEGEYRILYVGFSR